MAVPPPPSPPSRRSTASGADADDPRWQAYTRSGKWVCPYCLALVTKRGAKPLQDAIQAHMAGCRACNGGKGVVQEEKYIRRRQQFEDLVHDLDNDPDWKIIDCTGTWYCPACTERIPQVRMPAGAPITSFTQQAVAKHLAVCSKWQRGSQPGDEYINRARSRAAFMPQLLTFIRDRLSQPLWRHIDPMGLWVCPHCLDHVSVPRAATATNDWSGAVEAIAQHLICRCRPFAVNPRQVHTTDELSRACAVTTAITHTPSGGTPLANRRTATGTRTTQVAPGTPPAPAPFSTTPMAPIATPVAGSPVIPAAMPPAAEPAVDGAAMDTSAGTSETVGTGTFNAPTWMRDSGIFTPDAATMGPETTREMPRWPQDQDNATASGTVPPAAASATTAAADHAVPDQPSGAPTASDTATSNDAAPAAPSNVAPDPTTTQIHNRKNRHEHTDVRLAVNVQQRMLQQPPNLPGYRFAAFFEPCAAISGDFYDFITLPDGKIGIALGDVSGHGVQAGLIMSMAKKTLEIYAGVSDGPADALARTNDSLHRELGGTNFVSMVYAVLDPAARTLTWARAGHNPPLHHNADGVIREIRPAGMVVGMKSGPMFRRLLREEVVSLAAGDTFLIFTDGITEAMNAEREEFGIERMHEAILAHAASGPQVLIDQLVESVRQFRGSQPLGDDATLVALRVD